MPVFIQIKTTNAKTETKTKTKTETQTETKTKKDKDTVQDRDQDRDQYKDLNLTQPNLILNVKLYNYYLLFLFAEDSAMTCNLFV